MNFLNTFRSMLLLVLFFFLTTSMLAQDNTKDQLFYIHEEVAKIDKIDQYESTSKEFIKLFADMKLDVPGIYTSATDDFHYYYLVPISNYGDVDKLSAAFGSVFKNADKSKMDKMMHDGDEATEYTRDMVFRKSAKLSYNPSGEMEPDSTMKFIHWDYYLFKPEDRKQVMDLGAQFKKLYADKKIKTPYTVWLADFGEKSNLLVVTTEAKDAVDFYQTMNSDNANFGKDMDDLWNRFSGMLEHFEHKNGHIRRDLSYVKSK